MTAGYRAAGAAFVLLGLTPPPAPACGFVNESALLVTLRQDVALSKVVLLGKLANARDKAGAENTDLIITRVLKSDPVLGARKVLRLPRHVPITDPKTPPLYLVFVDVDQGRLDPFRGIPASPALGEYLGGLLAFGPRDRMGLLRYCSKYLEHPDGVIAADAYKEFMKSPDPELARVARDLPPAKLSALLRDPRTPPERLRMYAFLFANRGSKSDAGLLRALLDSLTKQGEIPNVDGVLTGYLLLAPEEGRAYLRAILRDPSRPFMLRWSALRAVRFFYNTRPDVVPRKEAVELLSLLLDHDDMVDLPVEQLRRWRRWAITARVLALSSTERGRVPLARRCILRFALQSPEPAAARFVAKQRKGDPELVKECEESLEAERPPPRR